MMKPEESHKLEVEHFLQQTFAVNQWAFTRPRGSGHESYFAHSSEISCFVKVDARVERYQILEQDGLTPRILASGELSDGHTVLVQEYVEGRKLRRRDYHQNLIQIAAMIRTMHHHEALQQALPSITSHDHREVGLQVASDIRQRWEMCRSRLNHFARIIDEGLAELEIALRLLTTMGTVASHNDICNSNWLITPTDRLYILDLEAMAFDDPAVDIGVTLWWYYPPHMRQRFLECSGYADDSGFQQRIATRASLHLLNVAVPRLQNLNGLEVEVFAERLIDFQAALAGQENPKGYAD